MEACGTAHFWGRHRYALLAHELVVLCVGADPKPGNARRNCHTERAIMKTDTHRREPADALEVERRMLRIRLQQGVLFVRELLD
jgi:hypothetical protein